MPNVPEPNKVPVYSYLLSYWFSFIRTFLNLKLYSLILCNIIIIIIFIYSWPLNIHFWFRSIFSYNKIIINVNNNENINKKIKETRLFVYIIKHFNIKYIIIDI